jgi:hypothetical protein
MSDQHTNHDDPAMTEDVSEDYAAPLAALSVGDQIPWKLDASGEPQWLTVVAVEGPGVYLVCDPSGNVERLTDTE